ncbi:serine/threonine protein kinase [Actinomadura barringtoniae]|uniref:Serine/threonine protein kinase n=1 Tax=Actinomadura barringtoniae TaxID=1427535 RepID=A0A939PJA8_9ACTN|nr:serine/threonine-protein kinase [Actinomadura barringtoniae]MBO2453776.1 serine/threonine protein kinase [Actinomadura barringtoniae]
MAAPLNPADPTRLGDYEVLARLGTGGQGTVFLASRGGTKVAIKLLHAKLLTDQNARARFVRELALLQRVAGFCTAQMLEADLVGDRPYIVSEYVPGPSLRELVQSQGPRSGADLDRLAIHSVTALTAIHRAGIVHRDFKPQNVLMGPDGPRVIDFGIAKALEPGATLTSQVVGTPAYMAPEQFTGTKVGPSADLHAWAVTLLYAATGTDPFAGGGLPAVFYRITHETPPLDALPPQIAEVAAACLAKRPEARPSSEEALMWLLGQHNPPGTPPPPRDAPEPPPAPGRGVYPVGEWSGRDAPPKRQPHTWQGPGPPDPGGNPPGSGGPSAPPPQEPNAPSTWPQEQAVPPVQSGPNADVGHAQRAAPERSAPYPQGGPYAPSEWPQEQSGPPAPGGAPMQRGPYGQGGPYPQGGGYVPGEWPQEQGVPPVPVQGGGGQVGVADPYAQRAGTAQRGGPGRQGSSGGGVRRTVALVAGLILAGLLAALDIAELAILVARPSLAAGAQGELMRPAITYTVLGMVTLVGVVFGLRGSRAATWVVLVVGVLRILASAGWSVVVTPDPQFMVYAGVSAIAILLLLRGLWAGRAT